LKQLSVKAKKYLYLILTFMLLAPGCKRKQPEPSTRFHQASRTGDIKLLQSLIAKGANVNERDLNEWTPLHEAAHNGKIEAAELLISHGADVNVKDKDGWTPLFLAMPSGNKDLIALFVDNGADVNIKCGQYEETPLHYMKLLKGDTKI